jgi:hypothetical protein
LEQDIAAPMYITYIDRRQRRVCSYMHSLGVGGILYVHVGVNSFLLYKSRLKILPLLYEVLYRGI